MALGRRKHRFREKSCCRCFAYIRADSRKCEFCGYIYKSPGKYIVDKLKQALQINRVFAVSKEKTNGKAQKFFSHEEIEKITKFDDFHILMFLSLDDINLLDEMALIELGETLIRLNKH
jgi:hypothetical protein